MKPLQINRSAGICRFASSIRKGNRSPILVSALDLFRKSRLPNGERATNRESVRFEYLIAFPRIVISMCEPMDTPPCGHSGRTVQTAHPTNYRRTSRSICRKVRRSEVWSLTKTGDLSKEPLYGFRRRIVIQIPQNEPNRRFLRKKF